LTNQGCRCAALLSLDGELPDRDSQPSRVAISRLPRIRKLEIKVIKAALKIPHWDTQMNMPARLDTIQHFGAVQVANDSLFTTAVHVKQENTARLHRGGAFKQHRGITPIAPAKVPLDSAETSPINLSRSMAGWEIQRKRP
jgi:hypothetical protein